MGEGGSFGGNRRGAAEKGAGRQEDRLERGKGVGDLQKGARKMGPQKADDGQNQDWAALQEGLEQQGNRGHQ